MPAISRKTIVIALVVLAIVTLLGFDLARELRGPTAAGGYKRIFGESPPDHVYDMRIKYYRHLKGNGIYLGFRTRPEHLKTVLGFDPNDAQPMYFSDVDHFQHWQHESTFRELFPDDFPDLRTLKKHSVRLPDEIREFVISPNTGHVFCFRVIDSDIDL